jgi:ABC-type transport system involved in cytochrome c biogenesis permease subunit
MLKSSSRIGRWTAASIAFAGLVAVFYNLVIDNMPKGEMRKIDSYTPWAQQTIEAAENIPIQNGGRIKPLSTFAGFTMLSIHGARAMEIEGKDGERYKIKPAEWLLDALFRPQLAIEQPTFRVDNSAALEAIGVKTRGKRDRYSYSDIVPGREKLVELAKTYETIDSKKRDPVQTQTIDLAYNLRNYESLLGYFGFARFGVTLHGSGVDGAPDQRADLSAIMQTAPQIREQINQAQKAGTPLEPRIQGLLEQVLDASNFSKFALFILPPTDAKNAIWQSAGNVIMDVMSEASKDAETAVGDIKALETTARSAGDEAAFQKELISLRDRLAERAEARNEYRFVPLEATYYQKDWFLYALVFFLIGTIAALGMWTFDKGKISNVLAWSTLIPTAVGLGYCIVAMVKRSIIMQRPPVGNLYDTIIFIGTTVVMLALILEWMTRRRFALGVAPILGTLLIVLARRYELGDAKDHMDPLIAVLDSNFWLTTHVITITLGYSAGILSAFLSCGYMVFRGLRLDGGDKELRRVLSRGVYGMICLTLFLSLIGTVLGGVWANYSWGRFWGWDPKENGALLIVLWTLAILHARLGGYIREWGLHLASACTAIIVTFSWWHVNFLGVGLHNYGFTAGKDTIWTFYIVMLVFIGFGMVAMFMERAQKTEKNEKVGQDAQPVEPSVTLPKLES